MNFKNISYLFLLLMFGSCQFGNEQKKKIIIDNTVSISSENTKLSSIVSIKSIVPLETNDMSLIGDYGKILKFENCFYISSNRNRLLVFNDKGRYVNSIGRVGSGPGEYEMIGDFDVTKEGVYIRGYKRILQYSHDGTFIRDIPFDVNLFGMNIVSDKILGFVTSDEYVSHVFDMDGECINKFHPASPVAWIGQSSYYWPYAHGKYFFPFAFTNDLMTYDTQKNQFGYAKLVDSQEILTLDMENKLFEEKGKNVNLKEYAKIVWPLNSNHHQLYFITQGNDEKEDVLWIKDFNNLSSRAYYCRCIYNDVSFRPLKRFFSSFTKSDNSFLSMVFPNELKDKLNEEEVTSSPYLNRMRELADSLTQEDNFIIIEYDFK